MKRLTKIGFRKAMLVYSSMHGFVWLVALCLIKERRPPRPEGASRSKRRWLPEHVNGQLYSVAASIFFGLFGYLVQRISPRMYYMTTYTAPSRHFTIAQHM